MLLSDVLYKVSLKLVDGNTSVEVKDLQIDSRKIKPGSAFVAVKGGVADGHQFIEKAIENGAAVIVCEELPADKKEAVTYVQVENSAIFQKAIREIETGGCDRNKWKNDNCDIII